MSASTFARYCALFDVHGVSSCEPKSSLSTIHGVAQPVCEAANTNRRAARSSISAGSAGAVGVPTRLFRFMSQ